MPRLQQNLILSRCPHCSIANPNLFKQHSLDTNNHAGTRSRKWFIYTCGGCGGVITAWSTSNNGEVEEYFPVSKSVQEDIPERPRTYLQQALESLHAPAGAVMLAASAVDSMLKEKGLAQGTLYSRIEQAVSDHVITQDMATWAHEVRLDANDQRHADEGSTLPTSDDARRVIDFTSALAELLFVLPSRVQRGITQSHNNG
ncbi:MAG: DUF4145 domain-containing protein [Candidatus Sedimenticola sp. (ex Thyasira tokunagai)]